MRRAIGAPGPAIINAINYAGWRRSRFRFDEVCPATPAAHPAPPLLAAGAA